MSRDKKPMKHGNNGKKTTSRGPAKAPASRPPKRAAPSPTESAPSEVEELARDVFRQLLEQHAAAETIVDGLEAAGVEPEMIEALLTAARACIETADSLPEGTEELEFDDLLDTLIEEKGVDPEIAEEVVEAFFSLGDEA